MNRDKLDPKFGRASLSALGADDECLPGSGRTLRFDVYGLNDADLTKGVVKLVGSNLDSAALNEWERSFGEGIGKAWAKYGSLTWKQRREARRILIKGLARLLRAGHVAEWLTEVRDDGAQS